MNTVATRRDVARICFVSRNDEVFIAFESRENHDGITKAQGRHYELGEPGKFGGWCRAIERTEQVRDDLVAIDPGRCRSIR